MTNIFENSITLADYPTSQGVGGDYRYELWSSDDNQSYYLKIWLRQAISDSDSYTTSISFDSSREALVYFDCNYAERNLPECPK